MSRVCPVWLWLLCPAAVWSAFAGLAVVSWPEVAAADFASFSSLQICLVAEKFAPSKRWQIDTVASVLAIAGNYTRENVPTDLIVLIARSKVPLFVLCSVSVESSLL